MISTRGKGGCGGRRHPQCAYCKRMCCTQENRYSLHGFSDKAANISKSKTSEPKFYNEEYQEYLRSKSNSQAQSSSTPPSWSKGCILQSMESQNPWIIDSGASDHIYDNISLFSSLSFLKHFIS